MSRRLTLRKWGLAVTAAVLATGIAAHWMPPPLPSGARADRILIEKATHRLTLFSAGQPLRVYAISLGQGGLAPKTREGDRRTPEGPYTIDRRLQNSAFHRALHISYPNAHDTAAAKARGDDPGGAIMIHGLRNGLGFIGKAHRAMDWTQGCIAVTNAEIEEIWRVVPGGTPVEIVP